MLSEAGISSSMIEPQTTMMIKDAAHATSTEALMMRKSRKRRSSTYSEQPLAAQQFNRTLKYSVEDKLDIIEYAKLHGNRAAGRKFNVAESSIREWRKNEQKLINNKNIAAAKAANGLFNNNHVKYRNVQQYLKLTADHFANPLQFLNISSPTLLSFAQTSSTTSAISIQSSESSGSIGTPSSSSSSSSTPPPATSSSLSPSTNSNIALTPISGSSRRKTRQPQKVLQEP